MEKVYGQTKTRWKIGEDSQLGAETSLDSTNSRV